MGSGRDSNEASQQQPQREGKSSASKKRLLASRPSEPPRTDSPFPERAEAGDGKQKVFISWSGNVAQTVGKSLSDLVEGILDVHVFFSPEIRGGDEWEPQLRDHLKRCDPSLVILTPETLAAHWVIWEASALHHSRDNSHVIPVLLGVAEKEAPGPLSGRHAISFMPKGLGEEESAFVARLQAKVRKLVIDLNAALGDAGRSLKSLESALNVTQEKLVQTIRLAIEQDIPSVERKRQLLAQQLDTLCDTMDSPAYFMNKKYDITAANIAANAMFRLTVRGKPIAISHFIETRRSEFENFDAMMSNFKTHFVGKPPPPYFREEAIYNHEVFGRVTMNKVGILVGREDDPASSGWVVTWNLVAIQHQDLYLERMEELVTGKMSDSFGRALAS